MGTTISVIKTLIIPAVISLLLFLASTFILVPLWQRYRTRYSNYLPLETLSTQTLSLRARMQGAVARFFVAGSAWRAGWPGGAAGQQVAVADHDHDHDHRGSSFDSEDGEELGEVDESVVRRVLDQQRGGGRTVDSTRRLSRDLEEGFMDDSDEESDRVRR